MRTAKLSGEHLWSAWIRDLFPEIDKFVFRRQMEDAPTAHWWTSNDLDLTAKVVCESCNNGWMSDLEAGYAKLALTPMILSESEQILTLHRVASIPAFTFKCAVVGHFMDRNSKRHRYFIPPAALRRFARTLDIPAGVQMWIACARSEARHGTLRMRYKNTPVRAVNGFHQYAFIYSVGRFCVQMTIARWTNSRARKLGHPLFTQPTFWNDLSIPLWPSDGTQIHWPAQQHLSDQFIEAFSDRWARLAIPTFPLHPRR
jgi:hypothetical protein